MAKIRATIVAAALAVLAACAAKETKPADSPAPAAVKAPEPAAPPKLAEAAKPAEVAAAPKAAAPAAPEAPKAAVPATPATPAPAAPAPAVEAPKKKKTVQLGLPALATLKEDVGMTPKQLKSCREIYDSYKAKLDEAAAKVKASQDKKATNKEIAPLRAEVKAKLREVCSDDAQKAKFDEATAPQKKKAAQP